MYLVIWSLYIVMRKYVIEFTVSHLTIVLGWESHYLINIRRKDRWADIKPDHVIFKSWKFLLSWIDHFKGEFWRALQIAYLDGMSFKKSPQKILRNNYYVIVIKKYNCVIFMTSSLRIDEPIRFECLNNCIYLVLLTWNNL